MYCYSKLTHISIAAKNPNDFIRAYLVYSNYFIIDHFVALDKKDASVEPFNKIDYITLDTFSNIKHKSLLVFYSSAKDDFYELADKARKMGLTFGFEFTFSFILNDYNSISSTILGKLCGNKLLFESVLKLFSKGRKIFILNGNCQTDFLKQFLLNNEEFCNKCYYVDIPRIQNIVEEENIYLDWLFPLTDYCYSQIISDTNRFSLALSTNTIFSKLRENCVKKTFSNILFSGYYPQLVSEQWNHLSFLGGKYFAYGDKYIDDMLQKGVKPGIILETIKKPNFLKKDFILDFFEKQINVTKERDSKCDIQIFDFLSKYIRKKKCFHSFNHPHNFLIKELSNRILKDMKIKEISYKNLERLDNSEKLRGESQIIYPCVLNALGLKLRKDASFLINRRLLNIETDFDEWVMRYCYSKLEKISNRVKIDLWGSNISKSIFEFGHDFDLRNEMLSNPINTCFTDLCLQNFNRIDDTNKWVNINVNKTASLNFKKDFGSRFLIIDFADIRLDYIENPEKTSKISLSKTLAENYTYDESYWIKDSSFNSTDEEIEAEVMKFGNLLLTKYKEEDIILNKTYFALSYYDKNFQIKPFEKKNLYKKFEELIRKYENAFIKLYPKTKVLDYGEAPIAIENDFNGLSPLHYNNFVYQTLYAKLCVILNYKHTLLELNNK